MTFSHFNLDARIERGIRDMGYETPTPIQEQAIPHLLHGRDMLGLAQTGTGKTAAFALPILQQLTSGPLRRIRALIVAPTRELAEQIHQNIRDLGRHTRIRSATIYGGVGKAAQIKAVRSGTEIIVACPGRLLDLAGEGEIDLSQVETLVLDEADRMCDMGFLPDIRRILKLLPAKRQTLFFSATMPDDIRTLADQILQKPLTVQIGHIAPAKTVSHALYPTLPRMKKQLLIAMLEQLAISKVLVFTRTKRRARFLARDLEKMGYNVTALQGNMSQNKRQRAIDGFRKGKFDILVATDIASRGIDVEEITHVINFDMPDTVDAYTHRIGRTGRAEESGAAFTLAAPEDVAQIRQIEKVLGKPLERRKLPAFDYGEFAPERALAAAPARSNGSSKQSTNNSSPASKSNRRRRNRRRQQKQR